MNVLKIIIYALVESASIRTVLIIVNARQGLGTMAAVVSMLTSAKFKMAIVKNFASIRRDRSNVTADMARNYWLTDTVVSPTKRWRQRAMGRERNLVVIVFMEIV